jgi:acetoin utilization deacetylase AcuC-like enzyme
VPGEDATFLRPTGLVTSPLFLKHETGTDHPERPERLTWILEHLSKTGLMDRLLRIDPRPAERPWIERVHEAAYVDRVRETCASGAPVIDSMDTAIVPASYEAALLAAGAGVAMAEAILGGRARNGMALVRPPGHHAERSIAMGFCLFNNIAILARWLQNAGAAERVLIVDWDVHHGNGTQHMLEEDPSVFYFSIHQWPYYPGTGSARERGRGRGEGTTLNVPAPPGWGDEEYLRAFEEILAPAALDFDPDFVLVSAGFDAHRRDPLAMMRVTEEGYRGMTRTVMRLAGECCEGRVVSLLEGGYDREALPRSVAAHLEALLEP